MKIYINSKHEIKEIYSSKDETLKEVELDRKKVFGDISDFMILNYCYKQYENGYSIYPSSDYSKLVEEDYKIKIDETRKKVSILEAENEILKQELSLTQDAINEVIFMMMGVR